jgi:serine/threonine protein kinase
MSLEHNRIYLSEAQGGCEVQVELQPGQRLLDRFTVEHLLGRGGFSSVYLASDNVRSARVALKLALVASATVADRVKREIRLNARVADCRYVVRIHDVHSVMYDGLVLLLVSMEYADGGSLRQWLIEHRDDVILRRSAGVDLFKQATKGVKSLHDAGIVHGDLKPENLLIVQDSLKVSDLSLSRHICDLASDHGTLSDRESGPLVGTPAYMSPEQFVAPHPDDIDGRSDIYALGILLFELCHLRCRPPFGGSFEQLRDRHLNVPPPTLEGIGDREARVIARCLQKRPQDRYLAVPQIIEDLEGRGAPEASASPQIDAESQVRRQVDDLWRQSQEYLSAGNLVETARRCRQILELSAGHDAATLLLEQIQCRDQQARQFYTKIERSVGYQSLEELAALLREAVRIYPNHPDGRLVQAQLLSLTGQYDRVIRQAKVAIHQGQWQTAQVNLERARQINPGSPVVAQLCEFISEIRVQIQTTRNSIDAALERGQDRKALLLARRLDKYLRRMSQPKKWPQAWRTMHADNNLLLTLYRFTSKIRAHVFGRAR